MDILLTITEDQFVKLTSLGFYLNEHETIHNALSWMRDEKKLDTVIQPYFPGYPEDKKIKYNLTVLELDPDSEFSEDLGDYSSYYKAESKALEYMIKHLLNS